MRSNLFQPCGNNTKKPQSLIITYTLPIRTDVIRGNQWSRWKYAKLVKRFWTEVNWHKMSEKKRSRFVLFVPFVLFFYSNSTLVYNIACYEGGRRCILYKVKNKNNGSSHTPVVSRDNKRGITVEILRILVWHIKW